ncbi:MAG: 3-methylornithine--L-lysine ligase PylC, partial [Eggerthellaceae bacterium]|nr:3-methylornithine--L-lysine ligase PylC [Eggerthellaceae bacterium]
TPAQGLVSRTVKADVYDKDTVLPLITSVDAVIPAVEDYAVLELLVRYGVLGGTPVLCDMEAYRISSSKVASNQLFTSLGITCPSGFPECGFPVIVKPDDASGSHQVGCAQSYKELTVLNSAIDSHAIIQQYIDGISYSIEVIGDGHTFQQYPITEVEIAADYDSAGICAPAQISPLAAKRFRAIANTLGETLSVKGIFDIEAIVKDDVPYVLEIDARFPSQTPIAIYHATGINLVDILIHSASTAPVSPAACQQRVCLYRQVEVDDTGVQPIGEHPISLCGPLHKTLGFYGADVALTDYQPGSTSWRAIVVFVADSIAEVTQRWKSCMETIRDDSCAGDTMQSETQSNNSNTKGMD